MREHAFTFIRVTVDETGQVYYTWRCTNQSSRRGSAACSGAIFDVPVAFGSTYPELSGATPVRLLVPVVAVGDKEYRLSSGPRQDRSAPLKGCVKVAFEAKNADLSR